MPLTLPDIRIDASDLKEDDPIRSAYLTEKLGRRGGSDSPPSQATLDYDYYQHSFRVHMNRDEELFSRPAWNSTDSLNSPWSAFHAAADKLSVDPKRALEELRTLPKDFREGVNYGIGRIVVKCSGLMQSGRYDMAEQLMELFSFTRPEREFLIAHSQYQQKNSMFSIKNALFQNETPFEFGAAVDRFVPGADKTKIALSAYEMVLRELNRSLEVTELMLMRIGLPDAECKAIERRMIPLHLRGISPMDRLEERGRGVYVSRHLEEQRYTLLTTVIGFAGLSEQETEELGVRNWARNKISGLGEQKTQDWERLLRYIAAGKLEAESRTDASIANHSVAGFLSALGALEIPTALRIVSALNPFPGGLPEPLHPGIRSTALALLEKPERWHMIKELREANLIPAEFWSSEPFQSAAVARFVAEIAKGTHCRAPAGAAVAIGIDSSRLRDADTQAALESAAVHFSVKKDGIRSEEILRLLIDSPRRERAAITVAEREVLGPGNPGRVRSIAAEFISEASIAPKGRLSPLLEGVVSAGATWSDLGELGRLAHLFRDRQSEPFRALLGELEAAGHHRGRLLEFCAARGMLEPAPLTFNFKGQEPEPAGLHKFWAAHGLTLGEIGEAYSAAAKTVIAYGRADNRTMREVIEFIALPADELRAAVMKRLENFSRDGGAGEISFGCAGTSGDAVCGWLSVLCERGPVIFTAAEQALADTAALRIISSPETLTRPPTVATLLNLSERARSTKDAKTMALQGIARHLSAGTIDTATQIQQVIPTSEAERGNPGLIVIGMKLAIEKARQGDGAAIEKLRRLIPFPDELITGNDFQAAALSGLVNVIGQRSSHAGVATQYLSQTGLSESTIAEPVAQRAIISAIQGRAQFGELQSCDWIHRLVRAEKREEMLYRQLGEIFGRAEFNCSPDQISRFCPEGAIEKHTEWLPPSVRTVVETFSIKSWVDLARFAADNPEFYKEFIGANTPSIERAQLVAGKKLHLSLYETYGLVKAGVDLTGFAQRKDFEGLAKELSTQIPEWKDRGTVMAPLEAGAAVFGWERMFEYLDYRGQISRREASRHDQLFAFAKILELRERLDIPPARFFSQILDQVRRDGGEYGVGRSFSVLNQIAESFPKNPGAALEQARALSDHAPVAELAAYFTANSGRCESWVDLKNLSKLMRVVQQAEFLPQLESLRASGKVGLYRFLTSLGFDPGSSVDFEKVVQYWKDPQGFLNQGDAHSNAEAHAALKPGNYTSVRNLDLSAAELTEGLAEGHLDAAQRIRPYTMTLTLPAQMDLYPTTRRTLFRALGNQGEGEQKPEARKPGLLFHQVKHLLPSGTTVQEYLGGKEVSREVEEKIAAVLLDPEIGLRADTVSIRIGIHPKSSAGGILAGNRTACCMSFGAGKNNLYMFHLGTALLTVELVGDGVDERTLAQSLMRIDQRTRLPFPDLKNHLLEKKPILQTMLETPADGKSTRALNADNCEPAKNNKAHHGALVEAAYRIFLREYLSRFGQEFGAGGQDEVAIGKSYSTSMSHLPGTPNTWVTSSPIAYTDMNSAEAYALKLGGGLPPFTARRFEHREIQREAPPVQRPGAVQDLTFDDTFAVSALEHRVYQGMGLSETIWNIAPMLMAKDLNNAIKGRRNLSLKVESNGKLSAYLIAYQGKDSNGRSIVYLEDLASDPSNPGGAALLVREFARRYRAEYLDRGVAMPIVGEFREATTLPFIERALPMFALKTGMEFEITDKGEISSGEAKRRCLEILPRAGRSPVAALAALVRGADNL